MSSAEFVEWMAYYELEPFGQYRDNLHAGQVASLIFNSNRRKHTPPLHPTDFVLKDKETKQEEDTGEFMTGLRALAKPKNGQT